VRRHGRRQPVVMVDALPGSVRRKQSAV
jgi:hypothetical protein